MWAMRLVGPDLAVVRMNSPGPRHGDPVYLCIFVSEFTRTTPHRRLFSRRDSPKPCALACRLPPPESLHSASACHRKCCRRPCRRPHPAAAGGNCGGRRRPLRRLRLIQAWQQLRAALKTHCCRDHSSGSAAQAAAAAVGSELTLHPQQQQQHALRQRQLTAARRSRRAAAAPFCALCCPPPWRCWSATWTAFA